MKRKHAAGTARNRAGERQSPVVELAAENTPQAKRGVKEVAAGLWSKTATLEQTLAKIDKKAP